MNSTYERDGELSLKFKIAKQMVVSKHPFNHKRTQGEKNEDALYMMESNEFKNIWNLIEDSQASKVREVLDRLQAVRLTDFHNHVMPYNMYCVTTARLDEFRESELSALKEVKK